MEKVKGLSKGGWHPKGKDGGKESWRGDNKGINTIAGWMGKGKSPSDTAQDHQSTPLGALKDPASFGPPPKRVPGQPLPPPSSVRSTTGGLDSPLTQEEIDAQRRRKEEEQAALAQSQEPRVPSGPYRADTTGLTTAGLPKPPIRRADQASPPLPSRAKPPALPPRLPPRTTQSAHESPPPPYTAAHATQPAAEPSGYLNQGALNRLGQAGVSVPGFNIGRTASPPVPARTNSTASSPVVPTSPSQPGSQLGELQARFSKMNTAPAPTAGTGGTTWAQKQAALKTASDFKKDPSSVSLADARGAATTANDFRERHGEQVAAGYKAANSMNQKYGIMNKMKPYSADPRSPEQGNAINAPVAGKKAPPAPPAKKRELMAEPPPVPMSSKPKPGD